MKKSAASRAKVLLRIAVVGLSSLTMLALFWRFPLETVIAAAVLVGALALSAALVESSDTEAGSEFESQEGELHLH
ncbi:MAG: hypothetical protein KGL92_02255 [Gammaproteobacteria bacterium]|nr:hypothetical protein [Gammaproteobacteria bacterium]MDE2347301.1 hypothetical protein [Gammaproteobacteria bacterium]